MRHTYFEPFTPNRITKTEIYLNKLKNQGQLTKDREWLLYLCKNCGYPRGEHFSPSCPEVYARLHFISLPKYKPEVNVNLKLNIKLKIL